MPPGTDATGSSVWFLVELPESLRELVGLLPVSEAGLGAGVTGFVLVAGVIALRSVVRKWRSGRRTGTRGARGVADDASPGDEQPVRTATRTGTTAHDVAFTLPAVLPLSKGIRQVTHDEVHAVELGLVTGAAAVWLYALGRTDPAVSIVVAVVGGGLGYRRYKSKASRTLRSEPWYGLVAFAIGAGLGWLLFMQDGGAFSSLLP